eukprot:TRINITY_DN117_c5_g1_i1.p1 TRINITY_DN117_c5_g1~~TRINITY_DN117_c5_g1_i1.p1  ORF type:complete len:389 (+),score=187.95 TRINITY_DN117_c5_g1_i1:39-1205(+)
MSLISPSTRANNYLASRRTNNSVTQISKTFSEIQELYNKKLWHRLTQRLEEFLKHEIFQQGTELLDFYNEVLQDLEKKINPLKYATFVILVATKYENKEEAIKFCNDVYSRLSKEKEAAILLQSHIAFLKLESNQSEESKELLDQLKTQLDEVTGIDPAVCAAYYWALCCWAKYKNYSAEFYKFSLQYLAYVPLDSLSLELKIELTRDISIAALIGDTVFNFGELVGHQILSSLNNTQYSWLIDLLNAFNNGDLARYELLKQQFQNYFNQPPFVNKLDLLQQKICVLAIMVLVFQTKAENRTLTFKTIAEATKININDVEYLVMKAMSQKLVKGVIDQVSQVVHFTWVQPRVLDVKQILELKSRIDSWRETVATNLVKIEGETPELLS